MKAVPLLLRTAAAQNKARRKTREYRKLKAVFLNMAVPGLGQMYLKQRFFGAVLAVVFIGALVAALCLFAKGYQQYFDMFTEDMRSAKRIDPNVDTYDVPWLVTLAIIAFVDYGAAFLFLFLSKTAPKRCDSSDNS